MRKLEMRFMEFTGFSHKKGLIAFVHDHNHVYFSGLSADNTSTINAAELLITGLSQLIGRHWNTMHFYDIQTWRGYSGKRKGYWCCDQLKIRNTGGQPQVEVWLPIARWPYAPVWDTAPEHGFSDPFENHQEEITASYADELAKLKGLPDYVLAAFQPIIDGQEVPY